MAQITISLPDELDIEIRKMYEEQGFPTVSAFVADAVRQRLMVGGKLPYWERASMVMQLENNRMLATLLDGKKLIEDADWKSHRHYEVLREGYEYEYDGVFQGVDKEGLSPAAAKYVYDIMRMYEDIQVSAKKLNDEKLAAAVGFPGFDGNHEHRLLGFVQYLRSHKSYESIYLRDTLNSHGTEPHYRGMLERYNQIRNKTKDEFGYDFDYKFLTKEEINTIIGK